MSGGGVGNIQATDPNAVGMQQAPVIGSGSNLINSTTVYPAPGMQNYGQSTGISQIQQPITQQQMDQMRMQEPQLKAQQRPPISYALQPIAQQQLAQQQLPMDTIAALNNQLRGMPQQAAIAPQEIPQAQNVLASQSRYQPRERQVGSIFNRFGNNGTLGSVMQNQGIASLFNRR